MSDDLMKRLRATCSCNIDNTPCLAEEECRVAQEAADRIEKLEKELEYWRGDSAAGWDKCEEYRKKLAKAVEALQQLVLEYDEVALAYDEPEYMTAAYFVACTTLAELKGKK